MIEPPKLSPFGGTNDAYGLAALGKPGCENPTRWDAANPVQPLFRVRMFEVSQLKSMWVKKRFDRLRETYSVLPDVLDIFCKVPLEFHRVDHTTSVWSMLARILYEHFCCNRRFAVPIEG